MKTKENKGLQKLSESGQKVREVFNLDKITPEDFDTLNEPEKSALRDLINSKFKELKGEDRDKFINKIDAITSQSTRNQLWESNHGQITWAISVLMQEYGRMPTSFEIADKTGLSRQTVHKHLKEYAIHPQYLELVEQYKFMTGKLLSRVFKFAVNGDIRAARLYFDVVGSLSQQEAGNTLIKRQNNYIQINSMVLSEDNIKSLKPEQVLQIEEILKAALPETKELNKT